jgi:hypothetical protein
MVPGKSVWRGKEMKQTIDGRGRYPLERKVESASEIFI